MKILIEPQDVFSFRDAIPMAAGVGKGAGCRLPFPNVLHEALRSALLADDSPSGKGVDVKKGRRGGWRGDSERRHAVRHVATTAFASLRTIGPFPHLVGKGALFPMSLDVLVDGKGIAQSPSLLLSKRYEPASDPAAYTPPCLAVSTIPPVKNPPTGWWTAEQWQAFDNGGTTGLTPTKTAELWQDETRIGLAIEPDSQTAAQGQLYSGAFLRPAQGFSFAAEAWLAQPEKDNPNQLDELALLKLGGEGRLGTIRPTAWTMPAAPANAQNARIVSWNLVTPAVFAHGWLPGWLCDNRKDIASSRPVGEVCLKLTTGRAWLAAVCTGKPIAFSGWDLADSAPKPTQLAVPAGAVYYFVAESAEAAAELVALLHARPRSDFYGEKGFGYGFCRFIEKLHPASDGGIPRLIETLTQQ